VNFIRRFVNRINHMDDPYAVQGRTLAVGWSEYENAWIVWSHWTGEVCYLKEIRKIIGMIRDFRLPDYDAPDLGGSRS